MQLQYRFCDQLAARTPVGLGRNGEAITKYDTSFGERWQNDLVNVLSTGSEHEGHFSERRKARGSGVQQHVANLFPSSGAARFARAGDGQAQGAESEGKVVHLPACAA